MSARLTALIAEDEPLLREALVRQLAAAWPELDVVAEARNGREAVEKFEQRRPDICFLDVHMPVLSGLEAARRIGRRAHLVFVTAFDQYAVQAFEEGALDYLVKPVEPERLADTVARLKDRLRSSRPVLATEALLADIASLLQRPAPPEPIRWIRAQLGRTLRLIDIDVVDYFRSNNKYTLVAWHDDNGKPEQALVRVPLKELAGQLDPARFAQVHRSVVVNLRAIAHVTQEDNETARIHLKGRPEELPVSRTYLHLFHQM